MQLIGFANFFLGNKVGGRDGMTGPLSNLVSGEEYRGLLTNRQPGLGGNKRLTNKFAHPLLMAAFIRNKMRVFIV